MAVYTYNLLNVRRDLSDVLSTLIAGSDNFISLFPTLGAVKNTKHEWLEDQIVGRTVTATAVSGSVLTVSAADAAKLSVGTQLVPEGDSALFGVTAISGTSVTVAKLAANGSSTAAPSANSVLKIVSTPTEEGSTEGENYFHQSGTAYNYMQIFRKDVKVPRSVIETAVYGLENAIETQTALAMQELVRDLNRAAIFGTPIVRSASAKGSAGGLYHYGTQNGGLSVALATAAALSPKIINDASSSIVEAGGTPNIILLGTGQARVLSAALKDKLIINQADKQRGSHVTQIVNDVTGGLMTVVVDSNIPDTDAWVLDAAGFGLVPMTNSALGDEDTTPPGYDGIRRTILGEMTFEFKNAKQRLCRISNLTASATALNS